MLLFSRTLTLTGSPRRGLAWANEITAYVNGHTSLEFACWSSTFGAPVGTLAWAARVESQAELDSATASLATDDGYFDLLDQAADLMQGLGQDTLLDILYGSPSDTPPIGSIAQVTTATAAVDRMGDALAWSVEMAQHAEKVTGTPVMFGSGVFGQLGQVAWIGVQPDFGAADVGRGKLNADADYLAKMAPTKELFIPGSGHVRQSVRIA